MAQWVHQRKEGGCRAVGNSLRKMFPNLLAYHLGSELPQNAHDAARKDALGDRVAPTLRYAFVDRPARSLAFLDLGNLRRHIEACAVNIPAPPPPTDAVRVLMFEDDGRGLEGDYLDDYGVNGNQFPSSAQRYLYETGTENHGKSGQDAGRHGLGSSVGPIVSQLRASMSTSTRGDGVRLAMGRATLSPRTLDGRTYLAESSFGDYDGETLRPLVGREADQVHQLIGFRRDPSTPGLSVAVFEPEAGIGGMELTAGVLAAQSYQIACGDIVVEVEDEAMGYSVRLDSSTILPFVRSDIGRRALSSLGSKSKELRLLDNVEALVLFVMEQQADEALAIHAEWDEATRSLAIADTSTARDRWLNGQTVRLLVPFAVKHADATRSGMGEAEVLMKRLPDGQHALDLLVRDRIAVVGEKAAAGRISVTRVVGSPLSSMLGDSENAAHTDFVKSAAITRRWIKPGPTISAFKKLAAAAERALAGNSDDSDLISLAKAFPDPRGKSQSKRPAGKTKPEPKTKGRSADEPPHMDISEMFRSAVDNSRRTVKLSIDPLHAESVCSDMGKGIKVTVSVATTGWSPRTGDVGFLTSGGRYTITEGSASSEEICVEQGTFVAHGLSTDFEVTLSGFDEGRDFKLRARMIGEDMGKEEPEHD